MKVRFGIAILTMVAACRGQPAASRPAEGAGAAAPAVAVAPLARAAEDAEAKGSAAPVSVETPAGPQDVLVGTDVVKLESFAGSRAAVKLPAKFRGEQGGASASVQLGRDKTEITLTRVFQEPGSRSQRAVYRGLTASEDGKRHSGKGVEVLGVKDGILVLELESGVDGIPATLWIAYQGKAR